MYARSMTRSARSCMPQSQATATLPAAPSDRGTSFQPVPLQSMQFSSAMRTAYDCGGGTASRGMWELAVRTAMAERVFLTQSSQRAQRESRMDNAEAQS